MSDDVKPDMLKTTQTLLSKFIKKPPLTEKLLKKPPFRYLHDIITSIIKETGFLKGLYSPEEMTIDNNLDKVAKVDFLDKLIAAVKLATGANLSVKSSKIVSGLEVSKTHELLQVIGHALENKIDSKNAVEQILNKSGKKSGKDSNKSKPKENSSKRKLSSEKSKQEDGTNSDGSPRSLTTDIKPDQSPSSSSAKENIQNNEQQITNNTTEEKEEIKDKIIADTNDGQSINEIVQTPPDVIQTGNVTSPRTKESPSKNKGPSSKTENRDSPSRNKAPSNKSSSNKSENNSPARTKPSSTKGGESKESGSKAPKGETSPRERESKKSSSPRGKSSPRDERKSTSKEKDDGKMTVNNSQEGKLRDQEGKTLKDQQNQEAKTPREDKKLEEKKSTPQEKPTAQGKASGEKVPLKHPVGELKRPVDPEGGKVGGKSPKHDTGGEKSSAGKEKKDGGGKKESRPSSARPGSRKPLRPPPQGQPPPGGPTPSTTGPTHKDPTTTGPKQRPPSAMKRPPSAGPRPPSARPGAPRVKDRGEIGGGGEGETGGVVGGVNLIVDKGGKGEEEEEEMVRVEREEVEQQRKLSLSLPEDQEQQQGQLVNQILETQKELEDGFDPEMLRRTQIEWEGARKRGREAMVREIDKLKDWIQTVTKCAHPLGKLMGFFQEDVEEMQRELSVWKTKSGELTRLLDVETEKTTLSIEPLKLQLEELESRIMEESEQVSLLKMKIYTNDQRIVQLLKTNTRSLSGR
ncbi:hypothetical protein WDU94_013560 [Cyamophila willieti]